jgi:hypothetical protein
MPAIRNFDATFNAHIRASIARSWHWVELAPGVSRE